MTYPGDQAQAIEDYLRAKGNDGPFVSQEAYKAALRIAAIAAGQVANKEQESAVHEEKAAVDTQNKTEGK